MLNNHLDNGRLISDIVMTMWTGFLNIMEVNSLSSTWFPLFPISQVLALLGEERNAFLIISIDLRIPVMKNN